MISAAVGPGRRLLLIAPVRGLTSEAYEVDRALAAFAPGAVGIGVSAEELQGLTQYFARSEAEPIVPLTPNEFQEIKALVRFGEVAVPNPSFVAAIRWGERSSAQVAALDPGEEAAAEMFAEQIGYLELVRRTVRERRAGRHPPAPSTADQFAVQWEKAVTGGRGSRRLRAARDAHLVAAARRLAVGGRRLAVLVDRERFDTVRTALDAPDAASDAD